MTNRPGIRSRFGMRSRDSRGRFTRRTRTTRRGVPLSGAEAGQTITLGRQPDESPPADEPKPEAPSSDVTES